MDSPKRMKLWGQDNGTRQAPKGPQKKLDKTYLTWFIVGLFNCSTEQAAPGRLPVQEERAVNIFSTRAMNDSAPLARHRSLSSHAYFLGHCHTTARPSLITTDLTYAQVADPSLPRELEAV